MSNANLKIKKTSVKPEKFERTKFHYEAKTKYEISITFTNEYQFMCHNNSVKQDLFEGLDFKYDLFKRIREHNKWFESEYLPLLQRNCEYSLYQEISDPQVLEDSVKSSCKWPRIHYHGFIIFPNHESLLLFKLMTAYDIAQFGRVQINNFRSPYWMQYCKKDLKKIKKIYNENNIKYHFQYPELKKDFFK
ncbi:MAG: putative replicase [Cressdnaviricota sp.]|nr:MAG: putative replicase [Cressdnaviricota sp.]